MTRLVQSRFFPQVLRGIVFALSVAGPSAYAAPGADMDAGGRLRILIWILVLGNSVVT